MKILLVTEFFPTGKDLRFSGGVEARTFFVAKGLAKKNQVYVISSFQHGAPRIEKMNGFSVYRVGPTRDYTASTGHIISRFQYIYAAIKFGITLDIDLIDGGNYITHFIVKNIANYKKIPVVAWYPDVWLRKWLINVGPIGIFGEILERINLYRGFDAYVPISNNTELNLKRFTRKKDRIFKVYCGVDSSEFGMTIKKSSTPTVLSVSRFADYKNIKTLILAFALLSTRIKKVKLVLVGSGPQENKLRELAKELNIYLKVSFISNLSRKELIKLYKSSHVFSLPSIVEGFGIATIEAASAGLPFVNSNIPIHKEVTHNGYGGYLVDPKNPQEYSDKIYRLLSNKYLYEKKKEQAIKLSKNYSWNEIVKSTEKIYQSLI